MTLNMTPGEIALQVLIVGLSVPGLYLSSLTTGDPRLMFGYGLMLASQPLWILATVHGRQPGMLLIALFYSGYWTQTFLNHLGVQ